MHYARNTFSKESTIFLQLPRDYFVTLNEESFIKTFPFVSDAIQTTSAAAAVNLMYTFGRCIVANCLRKSCCTLLSSMSGHLSWHNSPASGSAGEPGRHARDRWGSFISTTDLANIYSYLYLLCSGQRVRLSKGDILQTTALYQCPGCGRTYQVNISTLIITIIILTNL